MLYHDYFFEFAGMPQAGKTKIVGIVAHYLKRSGYLIEKFHGGSEYSPLYNAPIGDLNLSLACKVADFVINCTSREKTEHKIYFLDKGLIDRWIFTKALLQDNKIDEIQAQVTSSFLTQPRLLECLDKVFIFVTSPELALQREYEDKLIESPGEVMVADFLSTVRLAALDVYNNVESKSRKVRLIDTEKLDTKIEYTAGLVVEDILSMVKEKEYTSQYFHQKNLMNFPNH